jgi:hypothetical protein
MWEEISALRLKHNLWWHHPSAETQSLVTSSQCWNTIFGGIIPVLKHNLWCHHPSAETQSLVTASQRWNTSYYRRRNSISVGVYCQNQHVKCWWKHATSADVACFHQYLTCYVWQYTCTPTKLWNNTAVWTIQIRRNISLALCLLLVHGHISDFYA